MLRGRPLPRVQSAQRRLVDIAGRARQDVASSVRSEYVVKIMSLAKRARRQLRLLLKRSGLRGFKVRARHRGLTALDVALASYPRSGNTWMRFLLYQLLTGEAGEFESINSTFPYVGDHHDAPSVLPGGGRLIKTHEDQPELYPRAIYVMRDPRDVVLSEHRYQRKFGFVDMPLERFVAVFADGRVHGLGSWGRHVTT